MSSEAACTGASERMVIKMEAPTTNLMNLDRFIFSPPFPGYSYFLLAVSSLCNHFFYSKAKDTSISVSNVMVHIPNCSIS